MTKKQQKNGIAFLGIQLDKWFFAIIVGFFLYYAYQKGILYEILEDMLGKEQKVLIKDDKKKDNKKREDRKKNDDGKNKKDESNKVDNEDDTNFSPIQIDEIVPDKDVPLEFPSKLTTCQIIRHRYYALCYDEIHEQPAWVAYKLEYKETQGDADREDDVFKPDEQVSTGSALPTDYAGTGYDRGHLAPAADFRFSEQAMAETFYMSNMSPQTPDFNRGIWKELEQQVRRWIKKDKTLYIVSGGILKSGLKRIGKRTRISVPNYFYKIILDLQEPEIKAIAFLMKNEGSQQPLQNFVVSIDEIEQETGMDFFPQLPDEVEEKLEKSISANKWFKSKRQ